MELSDLIKGPILLSPDNFTSLERTPWAGQTIGQSYKQQFVARAAQARIGESWEFSCDPHFPSRLLKYPLSLPELVSRFPEHILSPNWSKEQEAPHCEILVKLLNAASPLSLQVHPEDDDPHLASDECGKPESWLILQAERGAGIYLGFSAPLTKDSLAKALARGDDIRSFLNFVPVEENDFFDIAPGVPHAIGEGVTLVEPQRIRAGKTGKTYRLWDWNRRYDEQGRLDPLKGTPRPLHLEASLRIIDPKVQVGAAFVNSLRKKSQPSPLPQGGLVESFPANSYYQVSRIRLPKDSAATYHLKNGYGALIMLQGQARIQAASQQGEQVGQGQPALLPCQAGPYRFYGEQDSDFVLVTPSQALSQWS